MVSRRLGALLLLVLLAACAKVPGVYVYEKDGQAAGPRDAQARGIGIIHQELSLFPNLSIAENIFAGRELRARRVRRRAGRQEQQHHRRRLRRQPDVVNSILKDGIKATVLQPAGPRSSRSTASW